MLLLVSDRSGTHHQPVEGNIQPGADLGNVQGLKHAQGGDFPSLLVPEWKQVLDVGHADDEASKQDGMSKESSVISTMGDAMARAQKMMNGAGEASRRRWAKWAVQKANLPARPAIVEGPIEPAPGPVVENMDYRRRHRIRQRENDKQKLQKEKRDAEEEKARQEHEKQAWEAAQDARMQAKVNMQKEALPDRVKRGAGLVKGQQRYTLGIDRSAKPETRVAQDLREVEVEVEEDQEEQEEEQVVEEQEEEEMEEQQEEQEGEGEEAEEEEQEEEEKQEEEKEGQEQEDDDEEEEKEEGEESNPTVSLHTKSKAKPRHRQQAGQRRRRQMNTSRRLSETSSVHAKELAKYYKHKAPAVKKLPPQFNGTMVHPPAPFPSPLSHHYLHYLGN